MDPALKFQLYRTNTNNSIYLETLNSGCTEKSKKKTACHLSPRDPLFSLQVLEIDFFMEISIIVSQKPTSNRKSAYYIEISNTCHYIKKRISNIESKYRIEISNIVSNYRISYWIIKYLIEMANRALKYRISDQNPDHCNQITNIEWKYSIPYRNGKYRIEKWNLIQVSKWRISYWNS